MKLENSENTWQQKGRWVEDGIKKKRVLYFLGTKKLKEYRNTKYKII